MPSALSTVRPAAAAVVLLIAVAVTAVVLYLFWPAGVAVGVALGTAAVVAVGARMQRSAGAQAVDEDLEAQLGMTRVLQPAAVLVEGHDDALEPAVAEAPVDEARTRPATAVAARPRTAVAEVESAPALEVRPQLVYFTSDEDPDVAEAREVVADDPVRTDLEHLKAELGDDYRDFARAARLVVSTQYASAARLQRDLDLPYSRARRLLSDLEERHFVGPATGSLPRQVLMPKDRLPEVERLLADA
ncbi:DNA translocase FtsK [Amnibacterium setariae]|uniref:FtsK gamma domain-containing protein n=1 Tax=Amnibacterium setariae TaxID=2306585 RepID=A0A3A1TWJ6_9MICO|nr:DNA translocase FtsK [Amnibacterium setariae]RIX27921.1 hypothetical protein D1781_10370 [Amnibacterium setariae]